jgi:hypothetical protein
MSYMQMDQIYKDSKSNSFALLYFTSISFERIGVVLLTKINVPFFSKYQYSLKVGLETNSFITGPWKAFV